MTEPFTFYNLSHQHMDFNEVYAHITHFVKSDPKSTYTLSVGTDSHVHQNETKFITAIHIHRVGNGAWGCLKNYMLPRKINSIREKISLETTLTQEVAFLFTPEYISEITNILLPHTDDGADFNFEIHLDIGSRGATKDLIHEMTGRINAMGLDAKIKPDAYTAFSYANRYTK